MVNDSKISLEALELKIPPYLYTVLIQSLVEGKDIEAVARLFEGDVKKAKINLARGIKALFEAEPLVQKEVDRRLSSLN